MGGRREYYTAYYDTPYNIESTVVPIDTVYTDSMDIVIGFSHPNSI